MGGIESLPESEDEVGEGNPKQYMSTPSEDTESPIIECIKFPSMAFAAVDRRHFLQQIVVAQALFRQYREVYGEQGNQGTLVEKQDGGGDAFGRSSHVRWNDRGFAQGSGVVEGEEDCVVEGCILTVCELRTGGNDNGCADNRKQNRLVRDDVR